MGLDSGYNGGNDNDDLPASGRGFMSKQSDYLSKKSVYEKNLELQSNIKMNGNIG